MDGSISRFRDNYISKTVTCNIPEHALRWYVKYVEAYIKAHPGRRLAETGSGDFTRYLEEIRRKSEFPDWRFRKVADVLRILYTDIIKPEWADEFDWHTWLHDGRELGTERGILARIPDATVNHWITEYIHVFCRYCNHRWVSPYGTALGCSDLIRQICRASTRLFKFNLIEFKQPSQE